MKRQIILSLIFASLFLFAALPASAQGIIVPPPGVFTDPDWLNIDYQRVNVEIENQIAITNVDMQFTNQGEALAEGTFIFPLPADATVDQLTMYVDGQAIEAKILEADAAREVYNEIVRQLADPALLEYVGDNAIQASIFPIPPGESRRIEISYAQILEVDNGLLHYIYPLNTAGTTARVIDQMSISVNVISNDPVRNVYSPSHNVAISRVGDTQFRTGFESSFYVPQDDFSLYYGLENDSISLNLLTYKESANDDGFFMMLLQPPFSLPETDIVPKDVIVVLDQSGSMDGTKWEQAQAAALYVLDNLNPNDRFNVIPFSTGYRIYADRLLPVSEAAGAKDWIRNLWAEGGTDINAALSTALDFAEERPMTIIFLTDGLATEGIVETPDILENLNKDAPANARIFTFGVGDDVDTFLLDAIVRDFRGAGSYVRPGERIDEEVASLYNKISAPVLTDINLTIDGVMTELVYPKQLPDLFVGEQLTIVGRYRNGGDVNRITLSGEINGQPTQIVYEDGYTFREFAGGEDFLGRLWATRRIGDLLNTIRLNGESPELVDSVVNLSIRYGIITPYTSFLIEEDDILTQTGRERAMMDFEAEAQELADTSTGAAAVDAADAALNMQSAEAPMSAPMMSATPMPTMMPGMSGGIAMDEAEEAEMDDMDGTFAGETEGASGRAANQLANASGKTFIMQNNIWTDTTYEPDNMTPTTVDFLSDAYFDLLLAYPELADAFALGDHLIIVIDGAAYEILPEA